MSQKQARRARQYEDGKTHFVKPQKFLNVRHHMSRGDIYRERKAAFIEWEKGILADMAAKAKKVTKPRKTRSQKLAEQLEAETP